MADLGNRRVVTGLGADGRSRVLIDGAIPQMSDMSAALAWRCAIPADNAGVDDTVVPYHTDVLHSGPDGKPVANFAICEFAPGTPAYMHATDTIDFLVVLSGRVTLVLEDEEADLGPGDFVVDRGVVHGWRNDHDEPCRCAVVNLPALPVGAGRTI
jgi:quercetin dioxygenase-like cupin family protein